MYLLSSRLEKSFPFRPLTGWWSSLPSAQQPRILLFPDSWVLQKSRASFIFLKGAETGLCQWPLGWNFPRGANGPMPMASRWGWGGEAEFPWQPVACQVGPEKISAIRCSQHAMRELLLLTRLPPTSSWWIQYQVQCRITSTFMFFSANHTVIPNAEYHGHLFFSFWNFRLLACYHNIYPPMF